MAVYNFTFSSGTNTTEWFDGNTAIITVNTSGEVIIQTIPTPTKPSTKTVIKTNPITWNENDVVQLNINESTNDVTLQNLTTSEAVFLFNITNYTISVTQDVLVLAGIFESFNFEILDLGSFSFSNNAPMVKTYKFGNYNYMLNNITYNDGSTYLGLVRYDITDGKCHVFHLGRDFLKNFPNYSKETMYVNNNMFYITTTGELVMLLQAPTYLVSQSSNISYFVFILTGTQIFYAGVYTTTKNADETFMPFNNRVVFEDGDAIGYLDNSFNNYGEVIVNGDIYWGDNNRVILDDNLTHNLSIADINLGGIKPPLIGLIGFENTFQNSRAEVYFYDNIVRSVIYKSLPDMNNTLDIFSDDTYTASLDDNNVVTGGLHLCHYKTLPEWGYDWETTLNRVGFSFLASGENTSYIRFLNGFKKYLNSEGWEVKGNYVIYLPSIFNNALYCSNIYEYYTSTWWTGLPQVAYSPTFFVLTADFKFYKVRQPTDYTYPDIVNFGTLEYRDFSTDINMPSSLNHFGGVFGALDDFNRLYYWLYVVNPENGYPCIVDIDFLTGSIIETLNQEVTFQNPKLISQSQVAHRGYVSETLVSRDYLLTVQEQPLFIVDSEGHVWARGKNDFGQLGVGDTINKTTFTKLSQQFDNPIKILSYRTCTYFIYENGDIYCAGKNINDHFKLTTGSSGIVNTPVKSYYNYRDYKQIIFSEERITAVNKQSGFTYSGIDFPYELQI